jgi:hypothetical protein
MYELMTNKQNSKLRAQINKIVLAKIFFSFWLKKCGFYFEEQIWLKSLERILTNRFTHSFHNLDGI